LNKSVIESSDAFQIFTGKAMLAVSTGTTTRLWNVESAIYHARENVMKHLSSVARESYARSYGKIIRLQSLREKYHHLLLFSVLFGGAY
jgi:hypothetical protein